jgi:glutamyl-tRNA reductase
MEQSSEHTLFLIGISHKTATVEIREKLALDGTVLETVLKNVRATEGVSGCVALSTCNRTEVYAAVRASCASARDGIRDLLVGLAGPGAGVAEHLYAYEGEQVVAHLFRVVSGLDSMILGEPQIFGQVKAAYSLACDFKTDCSLINRLFHRAFHVGKRIRSLTSIGEGTVSVSFAAVELSRRMFGDLTGLSVLLAGTGKTGELCARRLMESGVERLLVANRTPSRAADLAVRLSGEAVPFDSIVELCGEVDILIASTASREPVITRDALAPVLERRDGRPLFLIDLGVPRNIDPAVSGFSCVKLYDIDDLEDVTLGNRERRMNEAGKAEEIAREEVAVFLNGLKELDIVPVIRSFHDSCEDIRIEELEKIRNRVNTETFETLDLVTRRIVRKILHRPTVAMRSSPAGEDRERMLSLLLEMFIGPGEGDSPDADAPHGTPDEDAD